MIKANLQAFVEQCDRLADEARSLKVFALKMAQAQEILAEVGQAMPKANEDALLAEMDARMQKAQEQAAKLAEVAEAEVDLKPVVDGVKAGK